MKPITLRAHNLDVLYQIKKVSLDAISIEKRNRLLELLYGKSFRQRFIQFFSEVNNNTLIEIVSINDDVCDKLFCPYSAYCKSEDYSSVSKMMIEKLPPETDPLVIATLQVLTPKIGDRFACRKYGLEIGRVYRFGDINIVEEKPRLDDLLF